MQTQSAETQATMTPEKSLQVLKDGNERFVSNQRTARNLNQQVAETTKGQWPFATVIGCIDSRAPAELVFDQGIGDVFNVRIAGNCINDDILGSCEFSCKVAGAKLIVVLGHSHCGAIKGACDGVELGKLTILLDKLKPAVEATSEPGDAAQRTSGNPAFVQSVADRNVEMMTRKLLAESAVLAEMHKDGAIGVVGAMYDIETGKVTFGELLAR